MHSFLHFAAVLFVYAPFPALCAQHFGDQSLSRARLVGELEKCDGGFFSYNNTRWFVLTDDAIYLFKSQPQRGDEPESGISLTYTTCTDAKVKGKKPHTFCISTLDIKCVQLAMACFVRIFFVRLLLFRIRARRESFLVWARL
jgi:hypothetical protein